MKTISPGPWETSLHNMIIDAEGKDVCDVVDYWVGETPDGEAIHDNERTWINAQLLAAAPDLLAALQAWHDLFAPVERPNTEGAALLAQTRAALAKATGDTTNA